MSFGKTLFKIRESKGISRDKLAEHLGIEASYLKDVEEGMEWPLWPFRIEKMAKLLDVDPRPLHLAALQYFYDQILSYSGKWEMEESFVVFDSIYSDLSCLLERLSERKKETENED